MNNFKNRVEQFWQWFIENEKKMAEYVKNLKDHKPTEVLDFLSSGLHLAIDDVRFEIGGDNEINLAPEGVMTLFFLNRYLVENMPRELQGRWLFNPWKKALADYQINACGLAISSDEILINLETLADSACFGLEFYHKDFAKIEESAAYNIFYIMMEVILGENIAMSHIRGVKMVADVSESMIPLSSLLDRMKEELAKDDKILIEDPSQVVVGYHLESSDSPVPRLDTLSGFMSLPELLSDYLDDDDYSTANLLENNGCKAAFIYYPLGEDGDCQADLDLRFEIAASLEKEILGEGKGALGQLIGQALGSKNAYIDLLLFAEEEFLAQAPKVLDRYNCQFFYQDFKQGAPATELIKSRQKH